MSALLQTASQHGNNVKLYIFILTFTAFSIVSFIFMDMQKGLEAHFAAPKALLSPSRPSKNTYTNNDHQQSETDTETETETQQDWEPFNNTNPHRNSWCPYAQCLNSPLCTPCNQRFFFLASTARSGSTTLLRMFNALPHIRLSGENHNQLYVISRLTHNLDTHRPYILKHPVDKPTGPFQHNTIPEGSMGCVAQTAVKSLNPPPLEMQKRKIANVGEYGRGLILGFKTVRLHQGNWTAEEAAVYLKTHFPCSKVLINYQTNVTHEYLSFKRTFHGNGGDGDDGSYKKDEKVQEYKGPSIAYFKQINKFQEEFNHYLGDEMSRLIDMDQWVHDVEILNSVIRWMGYKKCRFNKIVHENDKGYSTDKETVLSVGKECSYPYFL